MENISIISQELHIMEIQNIIKYSLPKGRIVPPFKSRYSDMLSYVYSGEVVYYFNDGRTVTLHGGEILYLPKGGCYYYEVMSEKYEYIYIDMLFKFPDECAGLAESFVLKKTSKSTQAAFERMNLLWLTHPLGYYSKCLGILNNTYGELFSRSDENYFKKSKALEMEKTAAFIQEQCARSDFRISEISDTFNCSEAYMRRLFRSYFGMSPGDYLSFVRVQNAKSLLENTEYSVATIAELCGYKDGFYFSKVFHKLTGCSPSQFRNQTV